MWGVMVDVDVGLNCFFFTIARTGCTVGYRRNNEVLAMLERWGDEAG